ncbi:hypothetical protein H8A95_34495 [Bradyrhizobium sp. Pear76]|uniref:hypothetical protein n=1 Tax=Bradyrhizobium oropedii TaxID=1571201 RepID=UPI001E61DEB7|nr:hypothetical protein [Bradyrhizobium oropedii]MCC8967302.1 hypothetical protein [Bradyrhizobium oropedii]
MLIFGAGAAGTAGMDETGSEIRAFNLDRNMAQAFEFPKGGRRETGWRLEVVAIAARLIAEPPAMLSRLPLPVRSGGRIDLPNMGLARPCRKRRPAAAHRSDSRYGNPWKVNRFCLI